MPKVSDAYVEQRREQILDAALRCFSLQGLHRTTLDDICADVGLSKGAVYNYFKSKKEIVQALRDRSAADEEAPMSPLVEPGGLEGLRAVAREVFGRMDDRSERDARRVGAMLWSEALLDSEILRSQVDSTEAYRPKFDAAIVAAQEAGTLPSSIEPRALSVLILGAVIGVQLQHEWEPGIDVGAVGEAVDALLTASGNA